MEPQSFDVLRKKLLDQHYEKYDALGRLVLTLASGAFALLAAFSGTLLSGSQYVLFAKTAFPLLLVSMLAGLLVQHRQMLRPLHDLEEAERLTEKARKDGKGTEPILLRRKPSKIEQIFFRIQLWTFGLAFILLAWYAFFNE